MSTELDQLREWMAWPKYLKPTCIQGGVPWGVNLNMQKTMLSRTYTVKTVENGTWCEIQVHDGPSSWPTMWVPLFYLIDCEPIEKPKA